MVTTQPPPEKTEVRLSGSQRKTAHAVRVNCDSMVEEYGVNRIGFLTLTIGDYVGGGFVGVSDAKEAQRRINSLATHVLKVFFGKVVLVRERHKSGNIHCHAVVSIRRDVDIRTGFDFDAVKRRDYRSVSVYLRALWKRFRELLPLYGFGRAELTPVKKTGEALASYIAKYLEKELDERTEDDYGKKRVTYIGWGRRQLRPNDFSWATPGAARWRRDAARLGALVGIETRAEAAEAMGPRWAWRMTRIMGMGPDVMDFATSNFAAGQRVRGMMERWMRKLWIKRYEQRNRPVLAMWRTKGWRPLTIRRQRVFVMQA